MDLVLDPNDGRETGLNQPLRTPRRQPAERRPWYADAVNDLIGRVVDRYALEVTTAAEALAVDGLEMEPLEVVADPIDPAAETWTFTIRGTYKVRLPVAR